MLSKKQSVVKLDFDVAKEPDMEPIWQLLRRAGYTAVDVLVKRSPSKRGWHMLLVLDPRPRTAMEVVAIQAVLGSDPQREAMQLARARAFPKCPAFMRDAWNVLYASDSRRSRRINLRKLGRAK